MTALDLLRAIQVHEEAESNLQDRGYHYSSYQSKYKAPHKPGQDKFSKKTEGYTAKVTQLPDEEQSEYTELTDVSYVDENYEVGYYKGVLQAGDLHDDTGRCFNCNEVGHKWKECTKPQREGLKCTYE